MRALFMMAVVAMFLRAAEVATLCAIDSTAAETRPLSRELPLAPQGSLPPGFSELAPEITGIQFTNFLSDSRSLTNQIFLNGSGVAAGDVDGDGLCDLYFCGLDSGNALYRNLGNWRFADITTAAGVACTDQASTGAVLADIDGDGDLDLLVNGVARGTRLFLNNGHGVFTESTDRSGLRNTAGSTSMTLADVNGDGLLDLYVVNYRNDTMRDMPDMQFSVGVTNGVYQLLAVNGQLASHPDFLGRFSFSRDSGVLENGQPDVLFLNRGKGRFERVSWTDGTFLDEGGRKCEIPYDWGLSAMFRDINGDGAPDLYVCNDFQSPDRIWINDGKGHFRALPRYAIRQTSLFSMGVDFADLDRDGYVDFFVADMLSREHPARQMQVMGPAAFAQVRGGLGDRPQFSRNTLFHNRGNGTYEELAQFSGVDASDWSWCPAFLDVDLDGFEDLLISTGHWRDAQNADMARELDELKAQQHLSFQEQLQQRKRFPRLEVPNAAFRNRGDLTFEDVSAAWHFNSRRISQGMALADLDNDGDLDVIINTLNTGPLIYRNNASAPRIAVRLRGQAPNTRGIGATIRVIAPGLPTQSQEIISGGRYLSSDEPMRCFAAGRATNRMTLEVKWRNGRISTLSNVLANTSLELIEPDEPLLDASSRLTQAPTQGPFFQDMSERLGHQHNDAPYDDFARQPLLPRKLSQLGPGVSWFDFNGDGWDDLLISAGKGGRLAVFRNDTRGGFIPQKAQLFETPSDRDMTTLLGWRPNTTNLVILLGLDSYEFSGTNEASLREVSLQTGRVEEQASLGSSSAGPLSLADLDGDGDLDLFIGGRMIPGRFPEAASSVLLKNTNGKLRVDPELSRPLSQIGLVSASVFTDLDGDGRPELVLACDWGPVRIFRYDRGHLTPWDPSIRTVGGSNSLEQTQPLHELTGWWNSVAAGDFDNDGRLDLVVGNWGLNTSRRGIDGHPIQLDAVSLDASSSPGLLESHYDQALLTYVPSRDLSSLRSSFPSLMERFPTFQAFSLASRKDVLSLLPPPVHSVSAATGASVILLNRGDHFELRPLPREAQLSPVFGIVVGDLNGDGNEDLLLAQNFFGVSSAESRQDSGCGLWLKGNGTGGFTSVSAGESGFALYGEGRGAALSDYDHDGRLDIVVGQNSGRTRLFRNVGARPGLRIHLEGGPENPQAIGTKVQLSFVSGPNGPVHEIRAGGGYWSQDSSDVVLGIPDSASILSIRWPNGAEEKITLAAGQHELTRHQPAP